MMKPNEAWIKALRQPLTLKNDFAQSTNISSFIRRLCKKCVTVSEPRAVATGSSIFWGPPDTEINGQPKRNFSDQSLAGRYRFRF
jgi:hypothetical protein